ncbi:alpha/beta hydrolase fold protein [Xylanimonas cellulosilytica DSM 15894]|uniref:Alpha/beta hydrolase fold protein n=1 Tax=Xylanimonas cellulosilytica (strain DSM 15894 / JCM 12276 / CECT 5975 / KCTC 9989 / LMG 20990 / NBRC 107835 / XIL07) TaxID=446471 RepID=D1BXJ8_XYLCX|nr:alpha/beta hydrolase [Xylanimonas cellulosilytica]ACZ29808.1 alpha/beta hydrolase fold protein [Xylanimonas cellulosilytica DSM 15894]
MPTEPAVVFVHGMRTSSSIWVPQLAHLHGAGYDAVAVDLPAHGERRDERFTLPRAFEVIDEAIGSFGAHRRVALVGLSLGGYTTLAYAAREASLAQAGVLGHPGRLTGVVAAACCSDPKGKPVALFRDVARVTVTGATAAGQAAHSATTRWRAALAGRGTRAGGSDVAALLGGAAAVGPYRPGWEVVTDALTHLAGRSSVADLRATRVPVWLVNGSRDHLRLEEQRHLAAAYQGALVVVPGAGHDVNSDAPEAFNRVLIRALHDFSRP